MCTISLWCVFSAPQALMKEQCLNLWRIFSPRGNKRKSVLKGKKNNQQHNEIHKCGRKSHRDMEDVYKSWRFDSMLDSFKPSTQRHTLKDKAICLNSYSSKIYMRAEIRHALLLPHSLLKGIPWNLISALFKIEAVNRDIHMQRKKRLASGKHTLEWWIRHWLLHRVKTAAEDEKRAGKQHVV